MSTRDEFAEVFEDVDVKRLTDAQAACCMWTANRLLSQRLSSSANCERVLLLDGDELADHPLEALHRIVKVGRFALSQEQLDGILSHPLVSRYSKNWSISYNAASRHQAINSHELRWGKEAQTGIDWMEARKGVQGVLCAP